jgi:hypothetical protein
MDNCHVTFMNKLVFIEQSHRWLKSGHIKGDTESKIVSDQDQDFSKNCFKNKILKEVTGSKCRIFKKYSRTGHCTHTYYRQC